MKIKLIIAAAIVGAAGCFAGLGMAAGGGESSSPDDQVLVMNEVDRLHFEAPVAADLAVMNVRVFNPDNELVLSTRTFGESVDFLVNSGLPDGEYRYETVSIFGNVDLNSRENFVDGEKIMLRKFGTFRVKNGLISDGSENDRGDEVSMLDETIDRITKLAGSALDFLVPSAHAAPLYTRPDGDLFLEDDTPQLLFQYGANTLTNDGVYTWWLDSWRNGTTQPDFTIFDKVHNIAVVSLAMGTLNANSINVDPDGDIHWAGSSLNFDRGQSRLSIGTSAVRRDITISSSDPAIDLYDESTADSMGINYNGLDFSIYNAAGADSVKIYWTAPADSIHVQSNGNTGFGTSNPLENIHAVGNIRTDNYFRGQSTFPGFWLDETGSGNKGANVVLDGGVLQIQRRAQGFGGYEAAPMRVFLAAPMNSLVVNAAGYLGLGLNPTSPIHSVTGARLSAGGVWQNASSRELKENIHDIDAAEAMTAFRALKPVTYNYKVDSEDAYIGFIAEDVPEIVASKDRKTLSSMDMVALVTRVVQDQQDTIEEKSSKIEAMEQQLADQAQKFEQQTERMNKLETMLRVVAGFEDTDAEVVVNLK